MADVTSANGPGKWLRQAREEAGFTLRKAAALLGRSHVTLLNLETGKADLSFDDALKLCCGYNVPLQYLVDGRKTLRRGGGSLRAELIHYGLADLAFPTSAKNTAYRRREEVLADALRDPQPRVVARLPVLVLRATELSPALLRGFSAAYKVRARVGWILDLTRDLVEAGHLPGQMPAGTENGSPWNPPKARKLDDLGIPASKGTSLRASRRWGIIAGITLAEVKAACLPLLEGTDE